MASAAEDALRQNLTEQEHLEGQEAAMAAQVPAVGPASGRAPDSAGGAVIQIASNGAAIQFDPATSNAPAGEGQKKRRKHRGGKKKNKNRRQSFAAPSDGTRLTEEDDIDLDMERPSLLDPGIGRSRSERERDHQRDSFYRLGRGNQSSESLESEALLDHRDHQPYRSRGQSLHGMLDRRYTPATSHHTRGQRSSRTNLPVSEAVSKSRAWRSYEAGDDDDEDSFNDFTPLIKARRGAPGTPREYGGIENGYGQRRGSRTSSRSSRQKRRTVFDRDPSPGSEHSYDINNPPSMPGSPKLGPDVGYDDVMLMSHEADHSRSHDSRRGAAGPRDALIDIDDRTGSPNIARSTPSSPPAQLSSSAGMRNRANTAHLAEIDVCFPQEAESEIGDEDFGSRQSGVDTQRQRRRRSRKKWPDLSYLEDWSVLEKEERTLEGIRSRKVNEPIYVGGRLRPNRGGWHREEEDVPYRFTYFNETFQGTIHAQTISELLQDGQSFKDLFVPERPELSDSESSESENEDGQTLERNPTLSPNLSAISRSRQVSMKQDNGGSRPPSLIGKITSTETSGLTSPRSETPAATVTQEQDVQQVQKPTQKRFGSKPVFWLDVMSPTDAEMRVISKAFNIHPLTTEDILMQEEREKVELFSNYYFVSYRTFEQDNNSEDYLEPINMYVVVFGEGVISFHFSQTPHPANVRRRIRQISDYLIVTSDWISYAIIDDITDAYAPLIQKIEDEVDTIDEIILGMHDMDEKEIKKAQSKPKFKKSRKALRRCNPLNLCLGRGRKSSSGGYNHEYERVGGHEGQDFDDEDEKQPVIPTKDMLRRTGECRKRVMGLYRLLGTKADVIKGFAKRCNEHWEVAPRSEIGLYLGDIQDHIVTMTSNLSHYENLLSRAHSNYLAQINVGMNERAERTNDILGKLTVVGTIVLPMNIITGLWGMNCIVPGQDVENLNWFFCLTGGLLVFGVACFLIAKRVYGIV